MNTQKVLEGKRILASKLGKEYPKSRDEITVRFLKEFGCYTESVNEADYSDFEAYEDAYYSSERWVYYCKISDALVAKEDGEEAFKKAWGACLDWMIENYFPEFEEAS